MQIGVYHVAFDTDSFSIDAAGQRTIDQVANAVAGALVAAREMDDLEVWIVNAGSKMHRLAGVKMHQAR